MPNLERSIIILGITALTVSGGAAAGPNDNWPQFRGARSGIAADDPSLPDRWSRTEHVAWKTELAGRGWSSPVVWGDHVFVTATVNTKGAEAPLKAVPSYTARSFGGPMTGADIDSAKDPLRWVVYDVDARTGKIRWERTVSTAVPGQPRHQKNSYASETPVTDGQRVYAYFGNAGLFAFDMNGRAVWSKPMDAFKVRSSWASAGSPVLYKDRLYIVNDNDEQSFLAAFDKRTGAEIWRVNRAEGTNWTTPFVWENDQRTEIVTSGSDKVRSYDLSGKLLWEFKGMSTISIPTPFSRFGLLYISSGYIAEPLRPAYAIRPGASGDISLKPDETANDYIVWSARTGAPYNPTPVVYGDYYYTLFDRGFLTSQDAKTGKEIYPRQRVAADASGFTASPWAYNGKIFAISEDGDTYVLQAGAEFKVLGKNSLSEMTLATPAVARDSLFIRTASKLYRISAAGR